MQTESVTDGSVISSIRQLYKYRSRKGWIFFFLHQSRLLQRLIQLVPWFDSSNEPTNDIHTCTGQQTSHVCDCHSVPDLSKSLLVRLLDPAVQVNSSYYTKEASLAHRPSVNLHAPVIWMTQVNQGRSTTCVSLISGTPSCCHSAAVYKAFYASIFSSSVTWATVFCPTHYLLSFFITLSGWKKQK